LPELTKKLGGKKKVSDTLLSFFLCSAFLHVTARDLTKLCSEFLDAGVEEIGEGEEEDPQADHHQKPPTEDKSKRPPLQRRGSRKAEGKPQQGGKKGSGKKSGKK
jgi:hypothetical protein